MKSVEPPTQIPRFFLVTDRSPTQQQEQTVHQGKLLLIALLLTSSLFTVVLTNLSHLSGLLTGKPIYSNQISPAVSVPAQAAPIVVQIQQPDGTTNLTVKVIAAPAQPSDTVPLKPSAYSTGTPTTIILNATSGSAGVMQFSVEQPKQASNCPIN
jgi:hypothetical protein